jgi:hypothetical protein
MPLVFLHLPTANRQRFAREAPRLFLAQDCEQKGGGRPHDGEETIADLEL